jgi:hypothetical protein
MIRLPSKNVKDLKNEISWKKDFYTVQ